MAWETEIGYTSERSRYPKPTVSQPDLDEIMERESQYGTCEATDGCQVEPDGWCPHGYPSWMLQLGVI